MMVPDVTLLVYAHNQTSRFHEQAAAWWEGCLNAEQPILLPNICISGFVRIVTHPKVLREPLTVGEAFEMTDQWMQSEAVTLIGPTVRHYHLFKSSLQSAGAGGKLTTDAYLAALAMERQAALYSNNSDFSRFPGLMWRNPLA